MSNLMDPLQNEVNVDTFEGLLVQSDDEQDYFWMEPLGEYCGIVEQKRRHDMMRRTEFCCARARENTPHFNHPIHTTVEEDPKAELVEKKVLLSG